MSVGCQHGPHSTCDNCSGVLGAREMARETVEAIAEKHGQPVQDAPAYVTPSLEEQKRIIRDETVPEPIRRFWRQRLYGTGGTGRKGVQQEMLKARTVIGGQHRRESVTKELHGKQKKVARRLLRQAAKIMQGGTQPNGTRMENSKDIS